MKFNGTEITHDNILKTREYFVNNARLCIESAVDYSEKGTHDLSDGEFFVNDRDKYVQQELRRIEELLAGKSDYTFTFMQRAYWLQTGKMVALLP